MLSGAIVADAAPLQRTKAAELAPISAHEPVVRDAQARDELYRYGSSFFITRKMCSGTHKGRICCASVDSQGKLGHFFQMSAADIRGLRDHGARVRVYTDA